MTEALTPATLMLIAALLGFLFVAGLGFIPFRSPSNDGCNHGG